MRVGRRVRKLKLPCQNSRCCNCCRRRRHTIASIFFLLARSLDAKKGEEDRSKMDSIYHEFVCGQRQQQQHQRTASGHLYLAQSLSSSFRCKELPVPPPPPQPPEVLSEREGAEVHLATIVSDTFFNNEHPLALETLRWMMFGQ